MVNSNLLLTITLATILCWSHSFVPTKPFYSSILYAKQDKHEEMASLLHPDAIKSLSPYERSTLIDDVQQYVKTIGNSNVLLEMLIKLITDEKMSNKIQFKDTKSLIIVEIVSKLRSLKLVEKQRVESNYIMNKLVFNINWKSMPLELREFLTNCIIDDARQSNDTRLLIDTLWCLAKVKFDYKHTSITFKQTIEYILLNKISSVKTEISKLLYSLAQINVNWNDDLKFDVRIKILKFLVDNIDDMSESEVVNCIYSLGKMDVSWKAIPSELKTSLLNNIERVLPVMKGPGLANTVWSLGKTGIKWNNLPHSFCDKIYDKLVSIATISIDSHSLSSCIIGMSKMDISWSRIPVVVKVALDHAISRLNNGKVTEQSVGNILWGLGSMGANKANMSPGAIASIYDMICIVSKSYKSQGISNTLYGLAKMNWRWIDLPSKVIDAIESHLRSKYGLQNMPDYSVANIVWSLGQLNALWSVDHKSRINGHLSADICIKVTNAVQCKCSFMNEQGLSNTLLGLAKMEAKWSYFTLPLKKNIFSAIVALAETMKAQGISNTLWALSSLGVSWNDINQFSNISKEFAKTIIKLKNDFNGQSIATCLHALSRMDVQYNQLNEELKVTLEEICGNCTKMRPIETANILYGLGKMNCVFSSLPVKTQNTLIAGVINTCDDMDEQELGNTVWGLMGQMGLKYSTMQIDLRDKLIDSIVSKRNVLRKQGLIAILQGLYKNKDITWVLLPTKLRFTILSAICLVLKKESNNSHIENQKLVGILLQSLGKLQIEWHGKFFETDEGLLTETSTINTDVKNCLSHSVYNSLNVSSQCVINSDIGHNVASILSGLACMSMLWRFLDDYEKSLIVVNFVKCFPYMNTNDIASTLWCLSRMGFSFDYLTTSQLSTINDILAKKILDMTPYEVVWSVWSLSQLNNSFETLTSEVKASIQVAVKNSITKMLKNDIGVLLWAFGRMQAPINDFEDDIKEALMFGIMK